ncbi:acetamidase/formamidase family protein [Alicyclobacillus tolerans]|uniref:acetamidase/formamidase family protein n=1 Tax=Alicyclobacillus tolerans TaxID=90970 RepID=UPI001F371018|nr:acetamidase/formamidase family protein [Alicyclobacillus tolerans]MCF8565058.1 acetamidase/formamidase family protein [Alicyclobacillus tolerans]
MTVTIPKESIVYAMSPDNAPVKTVKDGDTAVFITYDCFENQILSEQQDFGGLNWERINPATGPVFVEGAEPGDLLVVHIQKIQLADHGVMTTGPDLGVMGKSLDKNTIRMVPVKDGKAIFQDFELPINPMIGVIGNAPADASVPCGTPGQHGGNMDCKRITEGAYLILPVNVPGALFGLGDVHAAMGDGEVGVCGVEIAAEVTVSFKVLKGKQWPAPMVIDAERVIAIASEEDLDGAAESAVYNMAKFLELEFGMDKSESALFLTVAGQLAICQVVDPKKTVRMEIPRWIAEKKGFRWEE